MIVLEELSITSMVRRPKPRPCSDGTFEPNGASAKSGLNRSIDDAGWGELAQMLVYKAEEAVASSCWSTPGSLRSDVLPVGTSTRGAGGVRRCFDVRRVGTVSTPT